MYFSRFYYIYLDSELSVWDPWMQEAQQVSSGITRHANFSISTCHQQAGGRRRPKATELSLDGHHIPSTQDGISSRHPTLITISTEIHVPFMETQHSGFYNICSKEGETRADVVPNSTVNTRCFFHWQSQMRTLLLANASRSWLTYLDKYTHHDSLSEFI